MEENKKFSELLIELRACEDARIWAGDKSWPEIYETCHRGDWLLWLFRKTGGDKKLLFLAEGHCANTVRHLMKDKRSRDAVDAAIAFGKGEISQELLRDAYAAAYAAAAAAYADADAYAAAAAHAAYAAAHAAYAAAAAYADAAADAAADYAAAAADHAAYADAAASARKENQLLTANIIRNLIPIELWNVKS